MSGDILHVKNEIIQENDIINHQYHTYAPYCTAFNNNDEIRITIQSQDLYVLPSDSYLLIEFTVKRTDKKDFAGAEGDFSYMFLPAMFSEMRYELNGVEIDKCKKPGITSLMKTMVACKQEDKIAFQLFTQNSYEKIAAQTYQMILPLKFIFGFCEDYNKIILNSKHELILTRCRSNANMYIAAADVLDFNVDKIHWKIPHISLSDHAKLNMLKTISRNDSLLLAYRSWDLYELPVVPSTTRHTWSVKTTSQVNKPRFVVVGFQTNRHQSIATDATLFDNCNISNMKLYLNNERYPYDDLSLNFDKKIHQELYLMYARIQDSFYNGTSSPNPVDADEKAFLKRVVFAFDCTRSDDSIKPGMVDVRLEMEARKSIPANTSAYCLIIHDNLVRYSPFTSLVHREI